MADQVSDQRGHTAAATEPCATRDWAEIVRDLRERKKSLGKTHPELKGFKGFPVSNPTLTKWGEYRRCEGPPVESLAAVCCALGLTDTAELKKVGLTGRYLERVCQAVSRQQAEANSFRHYTAHLQGLKHGLVNRKEELRLLTRCWRDGNTRVLTLWSQIGGLGKSALLSEWYQGMEGELRREGARAFAFDFYGQYDFTRPREVSENDFFRLALEWFGHSTPDSALSSTLKATILTDLMVQQRTLLILDGLQVHQGPDGGLSGYLLTFVLQLVKRMNGLCVIGSLLPVKDLKDRGEELAADADLFPNLPAKALEIGPLDTTSAEQLFRQHLAPPDRTLFADPQRAGILGRWVREANGHPLVVKLFAERIGVLLKEARKVTPGEVPQLPEIGELMTFTRSGPSKTQDEYEHVRRALRSYEEYYQNTPRLELLRLLSLFDRPAEHNALLAVVNGPPIRGLTAQLAAELHEPLLNDRQRRARWDQIVSGLEATGLVRVGGSSDRPEYNPLPLIRGYFADRLRNDEERGGRQAWQEAHRRLYEFYSRDRGAVPPASREALMPYYHAVWHGCEAGRHVEAFTKVYLPTIAQGEDRFFSMSTLGLYPDELRAMSGFFASHPWGDLQPGLPPLVEALVLGVTAFSKRATGDLGLALSLMRRSLAAATKAGHTGHAAQIANYVAEMHWTLGELGKAEREAYKAVMLADAIPPDQINPDAPHEHNWRVYNRTTLGSILLDRGDKTGLLLFEEAERVKNDLRGPDKPRAQLGGMPGARYCWRLFNAGRYDEVIEQATATLTDPGGPTGHHRLARAMTLTYRGLAYYYGPKDPDAAKQDLDDAVRGFESAHLKEDESIGLTARARFYREEGRFEEAREDADRAVRLAREGGARLLEADARLELARAYLGLGDLARARSEWAAAKAICEQCGYGWLTPFVQEVGRQLPAEPAGGPG